MSTSSSRGDRRGGAGLATAGALVAGAPPAVAPGEAGAAAGSGGVAGPEAAGGVAVPEPALTACRQLAESLSRFLARQASESFPPGGMLEQSAL
jgi:hypothetical protein